MIQYPEKCLPRVAPARTESPSKLVLAVSKETADVDLQPCPASRHTPFSHEPKLVEGDDRFPEPDAPIEKRECRVSAANGSEDLPSELRHLVQGLGIGDHEDE